MQSITVLQRFLEHFASARSDHPALFWIITGITIALVILNLLSGIINARKIWKRISLIEKVVCIIGIILQCTIFPLVIIVFSCIGDVAVETADLLNTQYFAEIAVISVCLALLAIIEIIRSEAYEESLGEDYKELKQSFDDAMEDISEDDLKDLENSDIGIVVKSILLFIISLLFIFTDLDTGLASWGFVLFKRNIGTWILGLYAAWSSVTIIRFILASVRFLSAFPSYVAFNRLDSTLSKRGSRQKGIARIVYVVLACFIIFIYAFGIVSYFKNQPAGPYTAEEISNGVLGNKPAINLMEGEDNYLFAKEAVNGAKFSSKDVEVDGKTHYKVLAQVRNDNPDKSVLAKGVRLKISIEQIEDNEWELTAEFFSSNAKPRHMRDTLTFKSDEAFELRYIEGSSSFHSHFDSDTGSQTMVPDGEAVSEDGILIGYDGPDGIIPGGEYVTVSLELVAEP